MSSVKAQLGKVTLGFACLAALITLAWTIMLLDKSYMPVASPLSLIGVVAWCFAAVAYWRRWSLLLLPIFALPVLPVSWWY